MGDQHYGCGFHEEHYEINRLINEISELENEVKKMVKVIWKCLRASASKDAYEYMKERNAPMTNENLETFLLIAQKAYEIKFNIMKDLLREI